MRMRTLLTLPLLGALIALPTRAKAQSGITITFGSRLGPEIGVSNYSAERMGDWRSSYERWTPVTLYDVNGHYYRTPVRGARAVLVYTYNNEYFLPPQDRGWNGTDRRYNSRRGPTQADYGRARPWTPVASVDPRLGMEIGVLGYSADRAGRWRTNYRRWTPVTLFEVNGRYYPNNVAGARPVAMYRYREEYFLPPTDAEWNRFDRRFDYRNQPNQDDRARVRIRP